MSLRRQAESWRPLLILSRDESWEIRAVAAEVLRRHLGVPLVRARLAEMANHDPDAEVAWEAISTLKALD